ncbi:hypothetical protein [Sabulicella rubraurantiaca]|uniref:hypothetical protein n=1 Tax=Sabulicella rubraurantiaca TaxID=2811429 RepID=UPI001A97C15C|nr:hypothetical protein [Sabulicella rubraurantiaca]
MNSSVKLFLAACGIALPPLALPAPHGGVQEASAAGRMCEMRVSLRVYSAPVTEGYGPNVGKVVRHEYWATLTGKGTEAHGGMATISVSNFPAEYNGAQNITTDWPGHGSTSRMIGSGPQPLNNVQITYDYNRSGGAAPTAHLHNC